MNAPQNRANKPKQQGYDAHNRAVNRFNRNRLNQDSLKALKAMKAEIDPGGLYSIQLLNLALEQWDSLPFPVNEFATELQNQAGQLYGMAPKIVQRMLEETLPAYENPEELGAVLAEGFWAKLKELDPYFRLAGSDGL